MFCLHNHHISGPEALKALPLPSSLLTLGPLGLAMHLQILFPKSHNSRSGATCPSVLSVHFIPMLSLPHRSLPISLPASRTFCHAHAPFRSASFFCLWMAW